MANDVGHGGIVSSFLDIVRDGEWPGLEVPTPYEWLTKHSQDATNALLDTIRGEPRAGPTWRALRLLVDRMMRSAENIHRLFDISPRDAAMDGASILRTLYDAHLQALYILKEPVGRGKLYVDFLWVELQEMVRIIEENTTHFGQMVRGNMQAAQVEQAAKAEFDAVKANYLKTKGGSGLRNHWCVGNLSDLAKALGYEGEYYILSRVLNGPVHSSPYGLQAEPRLTGKSIMLLAWHFLHRVMGRIAEYAGAPVEAWIRDEVLQSAYQPVFSVADAELADLRADLDESADE